VLASGDGGPTFALHRRWFAEAAAKPFLNGRQKQGEGIGVHCSILSVLRRQRG